MKSQPRKQAGVGGAARAGGRPAAGLLLVAGLLAGCRTCPMDACHIRMAHYHGAVKYRARPIWRMQYPAIGERIKDQREGNGKRRKSDKAQFLKGK